LRAEMQKQKLAAYILPNTDPHGSEYIAPYWQSVKFLTGFSGSAATVVVTLKSAALWTDSRYFLQAEKQLKNTEFQLMKIGTDKTPTVAKWLASLLQKGETVAADGKLFSINDFLIMKKDLADNSIQLKNIDIISKIWQNRPELTKNHFFIYKNLIEAQQKMNDTVLPEIKKAGLDMILLSSLDDIAWFFNIRGFDINYNPVVIAYASVDLKENKSYLFVDSDKVKDDVRMEFQKNNYTVSDYNCFFDYIKSLESCRIGLDFRKINFDIKNLLSESCTVVDFVSPTTAAKAVRTQDELGELRGAMIKDGVALVKFFCWLENELSQSTVTELLAAKKLREFRQQQSDFFSESFAAIAAYGEHAAIVHYQPTTESNIALRLEGLFLLDSGAQYFGGTTDITRTVALGKVSEQQKTDYTLVLKGHIALAKMWFPCGTRGTQLDVLARQFLWQYHLNYGHGTGHGVGHFLCVHEGPQSIRSNENPTVLKSGMVISNEPGVYRSGKWGIRLENLIVVTEAFNDEIFGGFLRFDTYSLFPFDEKCIDFSLLDASEIEWLHNYHKEILDKLSLHLENDNLIWLQKKCENFIK
jgi:Xaa-Pro aminopeptidase